MNLRNEQHLNPKASLLEVEMEPKEINVKNNDLLGQPNSPSQDTLFIDGKASQNNQIPFTTQHKVILCVQIATLCSVKKSL